MIPETTSAPATGTPVAWQDDQPFSPRYGDRYHTRSGARAQAEHVFLGGCGLPGAWSADEGRGQAEASPDGWTILETGFGLGLNFLSAWAAWRASPVRPARLRFVSTEAHPVTGQDIRRAARDDRLLQPLAQHLANAWPDAPTLAAWYPVNDTCARSCHADAESGIPARNGTIPHGMPDSPEATNAAKDTSCLILRFPEPGGMVELQLLLGDAAASLQAWHARHGCLGADSVFLDGFDPKKNPALWDARTMQAVAAHCRPGARIATWCVARSVRDALTQTGFRLWKRPGLPPKRHCLAGQWPG